MEYNYEEWEERMNAFEDLVQKNLEEMKKCKADLEKLRNVIDMEEVRKYKSEMKQMRKEMAELVKTGRYIRDDQRLVLSAPEIIIGDVDPFGVMNEFTRSKVILRGSVVSLEAPGEVGRVNLRASTIYERAENPGIDGLEHEIVSRSEIINQARNYVIETTKDGLFPCLESWKDDTGISILSDSSVHIGALLTNEKNGRNIMGGRGQRDAGVAAADHKESFQQDLDEIRPLVKMKKKLLKEENGARVNYQELEWIDSRLSYLMKSLAEDCYKYYMSLSELAETNRALNLLEYYEAARSIHEEDFKKYSTGTSVTIASENISISSVDGEGNLRDNPGAGINLKANNIKLGAIEADGSLKENGHINIKAKNIDMVTAGMKNIEYESPTKLKSYTLENEGNFRVQSKNITLESVDYQMAEEKFSEKQLTPDSRISLRSKSIDLSTMNAANMEKDENGKITKANYTAEGDIIVNTKKLAVVSADYDIENGEVKEKSLTKDSQLFIRTEKTELSATETNGDAKGSVSINAKDIALKSMDVNEDDRSDNAIAYEGTMSLVTNKINLFTSESIQLQSPKIGLFADETIEAQQGNGESALQLSGGNVAVGANMTQVYGDTEVRGELKTPQATIDNLEVKAELKSPYIADGMAAPVPSAGNLDTKLEKDKYEDIREELNKQQTEDTPPPYFNTEDWDF
jgi:hypothetical protein